jgi:hypothetical protein
VPTFGYMTRSAILLSGILLLTATAIGCGDSSSGETETGDDEVNAASLKVYLKIAESKVVFSSHTESFGVRGPSLDVGCRTNAWYMSSKPSLYDNGWSVDKAADFSEDRDGTELREYIMATCRNADTQIVGWFGKHREYEFTVPEQLLDEDYKASQMPLILQQTKLGAGAPSSPTYYSCNGNFKKTQVGENANAKLFDIEVTCKKRAAPSKGELGPIDFMNAPGPYAAVASYKPWMLPPVASTKQNFEKARDAMLAKVGEGTYTGAMSTLGKGCKLAVSKTGDALVVEHTIKTSNRTRRLELKADALLGFVEGDVFEDPIRATGDPIGTFAAAEFKDDKGESVVVRFEKNTNREGQIVRIDGAEAYCRRLVK